MAAKTAASAAKAVRRNPDPGARRRPAITPRERAAAFALAIACVQAEYQRLAVDANIYSTFGARYPEAVSAFKQRQVLADALRVLRAEARKVGKA